MSVSSVFVCVAFVLRLVPSRAKEDDAMPLSLFVSERISFFRSSSSSPEQTLIDPD